MFSAYTDKENTSNQSLTFLCFDGAAIVGLSNSGKFKMSHLIPDVGTISGLEGLDAYFP